MVIFYKRKYNHINTSADSAARTSNDVRVEFSQVYLAGKGYDN